MSWRRFQCAFGPYNGLRWTHQGLDGARTIDLVSGEQRPALSRLRYHASIAGEVWHETIFHTTLYSALFTRELILYLLFLVPDKLDCTEDVAHLHRLCEIARLEAEIRDLELKHRMKVDELSKMVNE